MKTIQFAVEITNEINRTIKLIADEEIENLINVMLYDAVILSLMDRKELTSDTMFGKHANLE